MLKRILVVLLLLMPLIGGCTSTLIAEPFEAWIVDDETGKLIEGANVVAHWGLFQHTLDGPRYKEPLEVKEAVTDKNGRFSFEGFTKSYSSSLTLDSWDPQVFIFKPSYEGVAWVDYGDPIASGSKHKAPMAGKTARLNKIPENVYRGENGFNSAYMHVGNSLENLFQKCGWKKMPLMIIALDHESSRLVSLGYPLPHDLPTMLGIDRNKGNCGSAIDFLEAYKK
jgi:hypothetical protein